MNGIGFIVRDMLGWTPPIPPPTPIIHPEFAIPEPPPKGAPLQDEHIDYITAMRGVLPSRVLAEQFDVSITIVCKIWKGHPGAGRFLRPQGSK
ncbi:hypothetical protein CAL20_02765 [Bordetella genomosp. 4]|uniref:Uncharacterized protein n=1 Tax=Bordetella genomosp. 4 TaxID=463044 RepID=A0A261USF8_9BORD|nr:hypothetical protein CAL20_02765 [Bordetella genomosp. 4]